MAMVLLRILESRFQADVWTQALEQEGIPYLLRTYEDTAYDGLWTTQKGYGALLVEEEWLGLAREIDRQLILQVPGEHSAGSVLAGMIEHTLLRPDATFEDLREHIAECLELGMAGVCVLPWMVPIAVRELEGSGRIVCSVVDFPLGGAGTQMRLSQAKQLADAGVDELDVVISRWLVASGRLGEAVEEMRRIAEAVEDVEVKVILETPTLAPETARALAVMLKDTGVGYLKTATGFFGPTTPEQVSLLREAVGRTMGIKAAGGIRTLAQAVEMVQAGADRLGTSSGADIVREAYQR